MLKAKHLSREQLRAAVRAGDQRAKVRACVDAGNRICGAPSPAFFNHPNPNPNLNPNAKPNPNPNPDPNP